MVDVSRRSVLGVMGAMGVAAVGGRVWGQAGAATMAAGTVWEKRAAERRVLARGIEWLTHEPLEFLLRRGDRAEGLAEKYARMCDPENIKRMAGAGVKWGRVFFYKGFGLEHERGNMETAKRVAEVMHSLGMKVSLYIGGTMFVETLYKEVPEAEGWEQRDGMGRAVPYGSQMFRHYACPNEPAYRAYLGKVLQVAVEEVKADELAFDNVMLQAEPRSCRCARCLKAFAAFLRRRYPTRELALERFGIGEVEDLRVNVWETEAAASAVSVLDDPVLQEWVRFRCESLANYAGALHDMAKRMNPAVAVLLNIKGVYSFNRYWTNAVYHPLYAGRVDLMAFDTGGYNEHIDAATGAVISQVRSYKMARRMNAACEDAFSDDIRAATHMAFGHQKAGVMAAPEGSGAFNVFTPLMEFFRAHNERYYLGVNNVADVAIVRNWASMAYSISAAYVPATLMEQVLIQYKVPFDLLFEEGLNQLPQYGVVVMAGQECVGDGQVGQLLNFVRGGGTLVVVGNTGMYDDRRARRRENPFAEGAMGQGKIVRVAEVVRGDGGVRAGAESFDPEPGVGAKAGERLNPPQWVLPKNHEALYRAVAGSVAGGMSLETGAPLTVLAELVTKGDTRETIVHFVNFEKGKRVEGFEVKVRKGFAGKVKGVQWFSVERDEGVGLEFREEGEFVRFEVAGLGVYGMAVVGQ